MRSLVLSKFLLFMLFCLGTTCSLNAKVELSKLFTDNMVLQQQTDVHIWGKASPSKDVQVTTSWNKQTYKVKSSASGDWKLKMQTIEAGGPYSITVSDGTKVTLKNVMLGEIWVCSGQSNMEMSVGGHNAVNNHQQEIATANYPNIRLFNVGKEMSNVPLSEMINSNGGWKVCSPQTIEHFSAVAYFFGRNLHQNLNVPIGLINTSWGGTPAQAWASNDALRNFSAYNEESYVINNKTDEDQVAFYNEKTYEWQRNVEIQDFGLDNGNAVATNLNYNDNDWKTMLLPSAWEDRGLPDFDGVVWFRKVIDIPAAWENKDLTLSLGQIDDREISYFNGEKIGETDGFNIDRVYTIPARLVKKGKAVITVRVEDNGGNGGLTGSHLNMFVKAVDNSLEPLSLASEWKYKVAIDSRNFPIAPRHPNGNPNRPSILFNAMINPLTSFAIKGFIWYQGESNADRMYQAMEYQDLFTGMIQDWRTHWKQELPFYYVQLANYMSRKDTPEDVVWSYTRESQTNTMHLQRTGMAVIIDIGDAYDIHPRNKQDVGKRLALLARADAYNEKIESMGPLYKNYRIEDNKIRICFDHTKTGLKIKDGDKLKGFTIAGADRTFYWADAVIEGDEIVVSSSNVLLPLSVRYAWANNPECNLYNGADLPASPFRTDTWIK